MNTTATRKRPTTPEADHATRGKRLLARIGVGVAAAGAAAAISLAGAGAASAQVTGYANLAPGAGVCGLSQPANFQVRADGSATNQGVKFKLVRNGVVVVNTPSRVNSWVAVLRSADGTFPGAGSYSICAQNTGTMNSQVSFQLTTDYEVR